MKCSLLLCLLAAVKAFQVVQQQQPASNFGVVTYARRRLLAPLKAVNLEPEPEGGHELTALTSMPGCRMKQMEERTEVKSDRGTAYGFWMTAEVDASLIKELRTQVLKDAAKKANFPGFRKGQVPPYAQGQITEFAVQESIIKTVQAALDAFGLKDLQGSDGQVEVKEDVKAMSKGYKTGDSLQFTATINAAYDPEVTRPEATDEAKEEIVEE